MRKLFLVLSIVLVLSLSLVACGGGGGSGSTSDSTTSISTTMGDFKFDPNEWTVPAGQEITLKLTNGGTVEHDWVLMITPAEVPFDEADESNQAAMFDLPTGQSTTVTFTSPAEAGDYQVVCSVPGHMEAGMTGTLHVVAP